MKIIRFILLMLMFLCGVVSQAQKIISYTVKDLKQEFTISQERFYIVFKPIHAEKIKNNAVFKSYEPILDTSAIVTFYTAYNSFTDVFTFINDRFQDSIRSVDIVLTYEDGTEQLNSNEILVKAKNIDFTNNLITKDSYEWSKHELIPDMYILKFYKTTTFDIFNTVAWLNSSNMVEYAEPNFIRLYKKFITNHDPIDSEFHNFPSPQLDDPLLAYQWSLKNGNGGINVQGAWPYAKGEGIKVAVIDDGVRLNHPDLQANLLPGYDATGLGSNGACANNNYNNHGTLCTGVIAAVKNKIGIRGVAYKSKIIPIRIAYSTCDTCKWNTNDDEIIDAFTWAKNNGADVISNSWGGGSTSFLLNNAITDCVENGRNGKGCVVLFATGNNNAPYILSPSSHPKVIAVGASTKCDERKFPYSCEGEKWGSNYGYGLSVVAPGVKIPTTISTVYGELFYSHGYTSSFNGTSSACPHVAGVVALVLSVNPNFTQNQVRYIIESTTDKIQENSYNYQTLSEYPDGTWSMQAGYGRVNGYKAVMKARSCLYSKPVDLFVRDSPYDDGVEPNIPNNAWDSPDIWVRHNNDSNLVHQKPRRFLDKSNYVYVRVTNKGCLPSSGQDSLQLYWSKIDTLMKWNDNYNGNTFNNDPNAPKKGDLIGIITIPTIQPNADTVLVFEWDNIPKHIDYNGLTSNPLAFALLARIQSHDDPIALPETDNIDANVLINNNIAQKSVTMTRTFVGKPNTETEAVITISGNTWVDKDDSIHLSTYELNEPADYNWYDHEKNLIGQGLDFSTTVQVPTRYKLEVVAHEDGYTEEAEIQIYLNPNRLETIHENPTTSNQITVAYKINQGEDAYLSITDIYNTTISKNYPLDTSKKETIIDLSGYSAGMYSIYLIIDKQIEDANTFIKQ